MRFRGNVRNIDRRRCYRLPVDATRGVVGILSLSLATWFLHTFFASLNELLLLADIRFFMQSITWAIWCLFILGGLADSAASAWLDADVTPMSAIAVTR